VPILPKHVLVKWQNIGLRVEIWLKDLADLDASIRPDVQIDVFATPKPLSHAFIFALERGEPGMGLLGVHRLVVVVDHDDGEDKH
jgi:hypothetical protein